MAGNRRRRKGLWIAGLAVIAAGAAVIWSVTRSTLVLSTSPTIANTGRHVRILIPRGWEVEIHVNRRPSERANVAWEATYEATPVDRRPSLLRWLLPKNHEPKFASVSFHVYVYGGELRESTNDRSAVERLDVPDGRHDAWRSVTSREARILAAVIYTSYHRDEFEATHAAICKSLRIE